MARRAVFALIYSAALLMLYVSASAGESSKLNQKGMDELRADHPSRAAEFFLQAIAADPNQKHFYNNLASAYMRMGKYPEAEEQLKLSLRLDPNYARALSNMSITLFHLRRYRESYKYYQMARKADRGYSEKRFERKRVSSVIKKLSDEKPDDEELKKIKEFIESDAE